MWKKIRNFLCSINIHWYEVYGHTHGLISIDVEMCDNCDIIREIDYLTGASVTYRRKE